MESDCDPRPRDMEAERPPPPSPDQAPSQQISRRTASPGFPNLLSIPLELQRAIASKLDVSALGNLRATCKQLECGLYETYVQTLLETPKFSEWFDTSRDPIFRISWTEAGLRSAVFILGIKKVAEHVKGLLFAPRDHWWSEEDVLCACNFIPDDADWPKERKFLTQSAPRCVELLDFILTSTPNVQIISMQSGARWPTTRSHLWDGYPDEDETNVLPDVQEAHEYINSEESLYDGECITQSFGALVSTLAKKRNRVRELYCSASLDSREVSIETVENKISQVGLEQGLESLRILDLAMESYGFTCKDLKLADRYCPNISRFFRLTQLEDLTLHSTTQGFIAPMVMDSILPFIQLQALVKVQLNSLTIRQKTLANFLDSCGNSLRCLKMYYLSLVDGGWKPIVDILYRYPTLEVSSYIRFELTPNGNYNVYLNGNATFYLLSGNRPATAPVMRRIEWGINEPISQSPHIRSTCVDRQMLGTSTMLWAGIYYAAQHDEVLEETREIRAWD